MQTKKDRRLKQLFIAIALTLALAVALTACSSGAGGTENNTTPAQEIKQGESLVIPVGEISGTAKFYPIIVAGTKMEVLAVKAPDGTIRTAFNTCEVCYDSGRGYYKQQGDVLICQNCGNRFKTSQVEVAANGCNPYPIFAANKTVTNETITISYQFLSESTKVFANWNKSY
ncbi:MAG: DUF2318 domain-containing protein [Oscillospiraceae bacterium]|jgi:uncharacterized membrane protein|nr:DUF2318 domain-containing protein [Oscillospiraceae bacterium]